MELLPLSNFVQHQNNFIIIDDEKEYTRVTAKLHRKGIVFRDQIYGFEIKTKKQQICKSDQLLVAEIDAKVGGYGIVPKNLEGAIASSHYYLFEINKEKLLPRYLAYVLMTDEFFFQIKAQGSTNYAAVRPKDILKIKIPYCDIGVQSKLIEKLDMILGKNTQLTRHLSKEKEYLHKLKEKIHQEAVSGKLVLQDSNDEPASELLTRIEKEKNRLIRQKRIKKEKQLPRICENIFPYSLPETWAWVFLVAIKENVPNALKAGPFGSSLKKSCYVKKGYRIYGQEQVINQDLTYGDYYINEEKYQELKSCSVKSGDILISLVGTVGKVLILPKNIEPGIINPRLVKLSLHKEINRDYIRIFLNSPVAKKMIMKNSHGSTMNIINLRILKNIFFPIPPVNEQRRIVEKVNELMKMCEKMEENNNEKQTYCKKLISTVLEKSFKS